MYPDRRKEQRMPSAMNDIDELQASMLRSLASAHRLRILHLLGERSCEVNEVARELGMSQAAASQHLGAMRGAGLVEAIRDGRSVSYRLSDPQILAACGLMRAVLVRRLSRLGDLAAAVHESPVDFTSASQEGHP
jgi:Predicted transcriptional regulator